MTRRNQRESALATIAASLLCACSGGGKSAPREFSAPIAVPGAGAQFVPSLAARDDGALLAWHAFAGTASELEFAPIHDGVPGAVVHAIDPLGPALRPSVAVTTSGYVIAYQVNDGATDVIRALWLDAAGAVLSGPETISLPGAEAAIPRVASAAGETAFAWTDGSTHFYALRGPETIVATSSGQAIVSGGLLNYPRIALRDDGTLFLAWRDGGPDPNDWDVLLSTRSPGGSFGAPVNVSQSTGLLSDDLSIALEPDGTLDLVWVDQDSVDINAFEVDYATLAPGASPSAPALFGAQHASAWLPACAPGPEAVWHTGASGAYGAMWLADPSHPPSALFPGTVGGTLTLARAPSGETHLAYTDDSSPRRLFYSHRP